jgi:hypothetical protein
VYSNVCSKEYIGMRHPQNNRNFVQFELNQTKIQFALVDFKFVLLKPKLFYFFSWGFSPFLNQ